MAFAGDPGMEVFYRSAAKPLQALPLVEEGVVERFGLTTEELALCCASHEGEARHVDGARRILAKAGVDEMALRCGPHFPYSQASTHQLVEAGRPALPIHNNCSGKHAGMVALAVAMGWDPEGYHLEDHPVQQRMLDEVVRWSGLPRDRVGTAVDGCGVVCFAVPLKSMALSFARFADAARLGESPAAVVEAMVAHPFMVGGTGRACTQVMERTGPRAFVKLGAEGVYAGGLPEKGWGFAIKVADGARRGVEPALVELLNALEALDAEDLEALSRWRRPAVRNTLGDVVGEVRADLTLTWS